jgi:hypothetical protein
VSRRRRASSRPAKAAGNDRSMPSLANDAVRRNLDEDADDLAMFEAREKEPSLSFDEVLKALRGKRIYSHGK